MQQSGWQVVHVLANRERSVARHFAARSVEHYVPLYTERSQWSDRSVTLKRPLFPGYVFIRLAPEIRLAVISTPGVLRVLGESGFQTVSEEELSAIRKGLEAGCILRPHPPVAVGTQVRVRGGIFDGFTGIVSELRQRSKVVMQLAGVERTFSLEVTPEQLEMVALPVAQLAATECSSISAA